MIKQLCSLFLMGILIMSFQRCNPVLDEVDKRDTTDKNMVLGTPAAVPEKKANVRTLQEGKVRLKIYKHTHEINGMTYYFYEYNDDDVEVINYTKDSLEVELLKKQLKNDNR